MKRRRSTDPNGFTLIELMIVIAVIGVLITLTIPLIGNLTNQARRAATKTTIKKSHVLLQARIEGFEREYKAFFRRTYNKTYDPGNILHIRQRKIDFRKSFPMHLGNDKDSAADNAEALLFMLTKMESVGTSTETEGNFLEGEIADTDGDNVMELVDSWGEPIRFYRWPTRLVKNYAAARILIKNLPANVADRNKDGDDPYGKLTAATLNFKNFHDFSTMHPPLIVSGGLDKKTGLYEAYDTNNNGHLAAPNGDTDALDDNITNLNNQAGDE